MRGRDHGIPGYNDCREGLGLPRLRSFREVTVDSLVADSLYKLYGSPDNCDPYICGLAEVGSYEGETQTWGPVGS